MKFGWAIVIAASGLFAAGPALAQSPWPEPQPQAAPSAWPQAQPQAAPPAQAGPSPWDPPPQSAPPPQSGPDPWSRPPQGMAGPPQQDTRCLDQFLALRKDVEKRGSAIQAAGQRKDKPSPKEACGLFNLFTAAEKKMYDYAAKNQAACGIPPQIIDNLKQSRAKSDDIRARVCQAAAAGPPRPPAPSLSDALNAPVPTTDNIKTGRGTFDTLTGSPLGR